MDLDGTSFKAALCHAKRVNRWFRLKGFLMLRSSKGNYHVVFQQSSDMGEEHSCDGVGVFHKQFQSCIVKVVYYAVHQKVKHTEV